MDLLEKINRSFGSWYEGLFGGSEDVRPKDILRLILTAMEDHRKEGFDNRIYVPNQYVLEIAVNDEEEKEYLLAFLDRAELETAIRRYCQQNHYHIRGQLDFTIKEVDDAALTSSKRSEKVRVRCRYNSKVTGPEPGDPGAGSRGTAESATGASLEDRTVPKVGAGIEDETGTVPSVASATLLVHTPGSPPYRYDIGRAVSIGRSSKAGNDLVLEGDTQISKRHLRIELDPDGLFTLYDLGSMNGTYVNGKRVDNATLSSGDEIVLGSTHFTFEQKRNEASRLREEAAGIPPPGVPRASATGGDPDQGSSSPRARPLQTRTARLIRMEGDQDREDFLLASETVIGRGVTNDIVLSDRSVATRHARIVHDGSHFLLEGLRSDAAPTLLNGALLSPGQPVPLKHGDQIGLGALTLRFEAGA
jgi:pSer/pThr/pTyr-binding forkhead associated (FHA) protein